MSENLETAVFASGCFWCSEAIFNEVKGVVEVKSGYSGGHIENPSYDDVCTGTSGHAESVRIKFDSDEISYDDLLEIFFYTHDPTTLNRQGNDVGPQYRSAVFYIDDQQKEKALKKIQELNNSGEFKKPIVTQVEKFTNFYPAESYHERYFERNSSQPYCMFVISPKIKKFRKKFGESLATESK